MYGPKKTDCIVSSRNTPETGEIVDLDKAVVDAIVEGNGAGHGVMIPILPVGRRSERYLPNGALERVRELSEIAPASIKGVATFYTQLLCDRAPR